MNDLNDFQHDLAVRDVHPEAQHGSCTSSSSVAE